jgi:hypothetical protein
MLLKEIIPTRTLIPHPCMFGTLKVRLNDLNAHYMGLCFVSVPIVHVSTCKNAQHCLNRQQEA